jgi:tRNA threonylcarbamoyl adenosine modification protein YeaZ
MTLNLDSVQHSYGLGLDTTTAALTLALGQPSGSNRYQSWFLERAISTQLHPLLQDFMVPQRWADLAWIAVLKGPGSFTGIRIGAVTARTLAQQLHLPLYGFSNLAIAAWVATNPHHAKTWTVAVSQAGQQGNVYGAIYKVQVAEGLVSAVCADQLLSEQAWNQLVSSTSGIDQVIQSENAIDPQQLANAVLTLGWNAWQNGERPHWDNVLPYYG